MQHLWPLWAPAPKCTHPHPHPYIHMDTPMQTHTHTRTHSHPNTHIPTGTHPHPHGHTHTDTPTQLKIIKLIQRNKSSLGNSPCVWSHDSSLGTTQNPGNRKDTPRCLTPDPRSAGSEVRLETLKILKVTYFLQKCSTC